MTAFDEIAELIARAGDSVKFGSHGEGVSEEWIARAEGKLGIPLPPSYKWWLRNYGGGEIESEEVYSIYQIDFDTVVGGDIVAVALRNVAKGIVPREKLYISRPGGDETFYFKPLEADEAGEYPVYSFDQINSIEERYADSFSEYLRKRIYFWCPGVRPAASNQAEQRHARRREKR
jgi:hypothetical protein